MYALYRQMRQKFAGLSQLCAPLSLQESRLANMERIIDWRVVADRADADGQLGSPRSRKKRKEYLLRWKNLSYLHASW